MFCLKLTQLFRKKYSGRLRLALNRKEDHVEFEIGPLFNGLDELFKGQFIAVQSATETPQAQGDIE